MDQGLNNYFMGCACAKERDQSEDDKQTLARYEANMQKQSTKRGSVMLEGSHSEAIRRLTRPIGTYYAFGDILKQSDSCKLVKVRFISTDQLCYLKIIPKNARDQLRQKTRLVSEMEKLHGLDHPYILRVLDVLQDSDNFYLAVEPFKGGQLADHIGEARICTESTLARLMLQVFCALHYCHLLGIIHGNLSLQTLVFPQHPDGNSVMLKVTGFGELDTIPVSGRSKIDESHFCAPERAAGLSEKCDVWSCGVILHLLLVGEAPFGSLSKPALVSKKGVSFSSSKWAGKSREVISLVAAMLEPDPKNRPTVDECRSHPWINLHCKHITPQPGILKKHLLLLKRSRARNCLQQAVLDFMLRRVVKEKELLALTEPFFALDQNGDGVVTREELMQGYMLMLAEEDAMHTSEKVFESADFNSDGVLNYSEFLVNALGERQLLSPENLKKVFNCINNQREDVPVQDIFDFFFVKGTAEKERQWQEILQQADRTGDACLTFEEFAALMMNINPT